MNWGRRALLPALAASFLLFPTITLGQAKPRPADIYLYQGPDRDRRVLEGARKEGTVALYTSLNLKDSVPITEAFEKKYPGVKVSLWRASSEKAFCSGLDAQVHTAQPQFRLLGPKVQETLGLRRGQRHLHF